MKKDIVMYKNGSFVDFQGVTRQFIVCALSTSQFNNDMQEVFLTAYNTVDGAVEGETLLPRAVFIGVAVCNPLDEWDEEKGKMIALSKARGFKATAPEKSAALFTTRAGMISELLVQALLTREVEHIKEDPECAIKGYNSMKARYKREQELKAYVDETPDDLKEIAGKLAVMKPADIERVINVAIIKSDD
jgi:hypothetical protein